MSKTRRPSSARVARAAVPEASRPAEAPRPHSASGIDDEFFRYIVSGMRNGVLSITRDGRLALINDEAYRIFGVTPSPTDAGRSIAVVLKEHPDIVRVLTGVFDLHHLPNRVEMRLKSGKVIGYTLALVRDDGGTVVGASMFFRDLTRVEQIEERERLRDRLAAVGEMAAMIAHEVKNPLAGIEVMAGLLKRKVSEPDAQGALSDIIKEAKMANAIVQEVLDFVRPIRLQVEYTTVLEAVQAAILLADTKARRGNIAVTVNVEPDLPDIEGDQHQLTQVFTNLLMNAYEAMDGEGRVTFTAERIHVDDGAASHDEIRVEIADDGPGIPQDVADRVFEPFFTTKAKGSGLGLAIVRKIVDAHDGRLDLKTAPGQGTAIRVTLPVTGTSEE